MDIFQRIVRLLDQPGNPWKSIIVGSFVAQFVFESALLLRQYAVLRRTKPPSVLEKELRDDVFGKSQAYGRAKARFQAVSSLASLLSNIAFIHYEALPGLWAWAGRLLAGYAPERFSGEISHSIVFLFALMLVQQLIGLPSSVYHTFVLEERFGFNKQTPALFVGDLVKTDLLVAVFVPPILAGFLAIVQRTGNQFFFYLWLFFALLQAFMVTLFPTVIQPLFNKLTPLEDGELKVMVEELAKGLRFPLHELFVIDGSKRSAHSNAYFFGLPWKKHIVLFDTLLEKSEPREIIAILAHELGHWKLGHTTRIFTISQFHLLYLFFLFSIFINNDSLYSSFGFVGEHPIIIGFILFSDALSPMDAIVKLAMNAISRKHEFEADAFAKGLGSARQLSSALIKLHIQNLSSMDADWIYGTYHFSHPHLTERLKALGWQGGDNGAPVTDDAKEGAAAAKASGRDEL